MKRKNPEKNVMEDFPKIYFYRRIVQAKLFMDKNFAENINLDNIAGTAFYSKFHFIRQFKKIYGKTVYQYLTYVRIEKAKELLRARIPVSQVCFSIGFNSLSSFSGLFKRSTSLSPSRYQIQQLQRQKEIKERPLNFIPNCFAEQNDWKENSNFREAQ